MGPFRSFAGSVRTGPNLSADTTILTDLDQPGIGTQPNLTLPSSFSALPRQPAPPALRLGQHPEEILSDLMGRARAHKGRRVNRGLIAL